MNDKHFTKEELVAYILLYAANSDFKETQKEKELILSKVDPSVFFRVHAEFDNDNDYQNIQKIIEGVEAHNYSQEDLTSLFTDLKTLFFVDGEFDILEQNMFRSLKKVLS